MATYIWSFLLPEADSDILQRSGDPEAPWGNMQVFGAAAGQAHSVAFLQSNFGSPGNLEIVALVGPAEAASMVHWWRTGDGEWNGPIPVTLNDLPTGASLQGAPAFLQSRQGSQGDFEVVVPLSTGGLAHIRRDNDSADFHWSLAATFGVGQFTSVSMLQSSFGSAGLGNFELVGRVENRIEHYWCDDQSLQWHGPTAVIYVEPSIDPAVTGVWRIDHSCEPVGIHAALLHTNRILFFAYHEDDQTKGVSSVFDPQDGAVQHIEQQQDLFCSGHAFLPNGDLLVAGGHVTGERSLFQFIPVGDGGGWSQLPDLPEGRWYPTCTTLPNGTIFILSGTKKTGGGEINGTYQIFHPALGLQAPQPAPFLNEVPPFNTYPWVFVLPSGQLCIFTCNRACFFHLGTQTFGDERIQCIREEARTYPLEGTGVLLPLLFDSSPPYRARVMVIGGGSLPGGLSTPATNTCEILDFGDPVLKWKAASPMQAARVMPDSVLLPDGTVLVMNGSASGKADNAADPVFQTDLYDPVTDKWTTMCDTRIPRLYHATALLLADGTVLTAGTDEQYNPEPFHYPEYRLETFYPPYLFRGPRPQLHAAPGTVAYGTNFEIQCDDANSVASVAMLRNGSVTHSFNMDQRYVGLHIANRSGSTVTVAAPPNGNVAPPGFYLLFVLNVDGVPSAAQSVHLS